MTPERWEKIHDAIFVVEIELDSAMCRDGGEDEQTKEQAERLLADATTLRKRLVRAFKSQPDGCRCDCVNCVTGNHNDCYYRPSVCPVFAQSQPDGEKKP